MRIALVHPRLDHRGGAENVVCWMARGLLERGHDVIVATRHFSLELWNEKDWAGIPLVVLGKGTLDLFKVRAARKRGFGHRLRQAIGPCDVIIAHNSPAPMWAVIAARRMRTRVIWYCEEPTARFFWQETMPHLADAAADPESPAWLRAMADHVADRRAKDESGPNFAIDRALERATVPHIDLVLGNSVFTAGNVARAYGIRAEPCLLGVPEPVPADLRLRETYVAWVTSPIEHKNAYGFLEALHLGVHRLGAADLRVRAVGLRGTAFEGRIAELSLSGVVQCESWLSDSELNELIAGCRLLAYPPIDEPFGLVPLHAMAHARAVLASNVGGPAETVIDGVTGALVDPLDASAMAERLVELWRAPERCEELGAAGRERYLANFTFDRFLDRFEALALRPVA